jgi:hypothetical protein
MCSDSECVNRSECHRRNTVTNQNEINAALARMEQMTVGGEVTTTDEYARQLPGRGLPWRGVVKRINSQSHMVTVKWLNSPIRKEETLHPIYLTAI